jgi:hypothetical protein
MIYPGADLDLELNDNIFAATENKRADIIVRVRPAVKLETNWQRHRLNGEAYLQQSVFARNEDENALEGGLRGDGTFDISRAAALRISASYDRLAQDRSNVTSPGAGASRVSLDRVNAQIGYSHDLDPLRFRGELRASWVDFSDACSVKSAPATCGATAWTRAFLTSPDYHSAPT